MGVMPVPIPSTDKGGDQANTVTCLQVMVAMRDGVKLNTFVFIPSPKEGRFPVILQRTPYGITAPGSESFTDCESGWLPSAEEPMRGSMLRGWRQIVDHGYVAVYQDTRGRYGSEGEDRVYHDDAADGYDTLNWIADQDWTNNQVGVSGSSAGATTALAAASQRHPTLRAFFAQAGGSSIYDDVVCEGASIEMERLWLWVSNNIPGLSNTHRDSVRHRLGLSVTQMEAAAVSASARYVRLEAAKRDTNPFVDSPDWMRLPLINYPDFTVWQPYLDEILSHPASDDFRARHNFRRTIEIPGFHVTTWFDIFLTSVIAAFNDIQARVGNQILWIGPNAHYFVYAPNFWPCDPYFEWFDHWLKAKPSALLERPAVLYSPRAWIDEVKDYVPDDWCESERWPPASSVPERLYLHADGRLSAALPSNGETRSYRYDPHHPIPTLGGRNMSIDAGPLDQRPLYDLPDYGLIYRSAVLEHELTIAGEVRVTLNVESDCPDTDFVAKLIELKPDGCASLIMDGVTRAMYRDPTQKPQPLQANTVYQLTINLAQIAHTFRAGSIIQIDVTSSNFPRRARNTNSGNSMLANDSDADVRIANNVIHHAAKMPSFIELPRQQ
jgi:putative CocE/NonD family hydrolase